MKMQYTLEIKQKPQEINTVGKTEPDRWTARININNIKMNSKLDSRVEINVLLNKIYKKLTPRPELEKTAISLRVHKNTEIPTLGKCTIKLNNKKKRYKHVQHL